jgi:hypothetical protein
MPYRLIDPDETLDYACDWAAFLAEAGSPNDTIQSSAWAVDPTGPALSGASVNGATARTFISGATAGQVYRLTNSITTAMARVAERSWTLRCENR